MANHNQNGGRNVALPEENQPSWRPQDPALSGARRERDLDDDYHYRAWDDRGYRDGDRRAGERDTRRWERRRSEGDPEDREAGRATERYGQGQSGYSAGRYGDDRSQQLAGRSDMVPSAASFEDRRRDLGTDDRFTGRGRPSYWQDRSWTDADRYSQTGHGPGGYSQTGYASHGGYGGRDFDAERRGLSGGNPGYDERVSYPAGSYSRHSTGYGSAWSGHEAPRNLGAEPHVHRGTGPHRGKGPAGYQRSDERIRELVCESLADDDQLDATHIEVSVNHGEVTLSGTVEDRRAKRDAEDCACSVSGVRDVQNLLRVRDVRDVRDDRSAGRGNPSGHGAVGRNESETSAPDKKHRA